MNRASKLDKLKQKGTAAYTVDGKQFNAEFSDKVEELRETLELGVEFNNVDKLFEELGKLMSIQPAIDSLTQKLGHLPNEIQIKGLDKLLSKISSQKTSVQVEWNPKDAKAIIDGLGELKKAFIEKEVNSQDISDYTPVRRVVKVGNKLVWDDTYGASGGSGGGIDRDLTRNNGTTVAVTNPDGSLIGSSSPGVTNDGTFATPARQDTGNTSLNSIDGKLTTLNAKDFATSAKQDTGNTSLSSIDTKLSSQATAANQSTLNTRIGDVTETAPASDTASSGLNGRLQRIAQRLTSIIALLPGSLGQKARAASLAVTLSTEDITALTPLTSITANPTVASTVVAFRTTVTTAGTRVQLASNSVKAGILQAPSTNTGLIYVGGSNVSSTVFGSELQPGQSVGIEIDNTNKIYIDSSVNGEFCAFLGSA